MAIYSTQSSIAAIEEELKSFISEGKKDLVSELFRDNAFLQDLHKGKKLEISDNFPRSNASGEHVVLVKKALRIVLRELSSEDRTILNALDFNDPNYDVRTRLLVKKFQEKFIELDETGTVNSETIARFDQELQKLIYDIDSATTIFNIGNPDNKVEQMSVLYIPDNFKDPDHVNPKVVESSGPSPQNLIAPITINAYKIPDKTQKSEILKLPVNTKVFVKHLDPDSGWAHVIVDFPAKDFEAPDSENLYPIKYQNEDVKKGKDELDTILERYININLVWAIWKPGRLPMPDPDARLYRIKESDTLLGPNGIISKHKYPLLGQGTYDSKTSDYLNNIDFSGYELQDRIEYLVNLLLYSNNPTGIDKERSVHLQGNYEYNETVIEDINIYQISNKERAYNQFLDILSKKGNYWSYAADAITKDPYPNYINIKKNYYMWIPGKRFASLLFAKLHKDSAIASKISNGIKKQISKIFKPGQGVGLGAVLGATFVVPIGVDLDGRCAIYRKDTDKETAEGEADTVTIVFKRYAKVGLGLNTSIGGGVRTGFNLGGGRKSKPLGADIGGEASAQFGGEAIAVETYEIPLIDNDIAGVVLLDAILNPILNSSLILAGAMAITKGLMAKEGLVIDPDQYLVSYKLQAGVFGSVNASAGIKIKLFPDEERRDRWVDLDSTQPQDLDKRQNHKTGSLLSFKNFLSAISLKAGLGGQIEISIGGGFEYEAKYAPTITTYELEQVNDRIPTEVQQTIFVEGSMGGRIVTSFLGSVDDGDFNIPGLGVKCQLDYSNNASAGSSGPIVELPSLEKLRASKFIPYYTYGEWDFFSADAHEYGVEIEPLKFLEYITNPENNAFTLSSLFYNTFIGFFIKKRFFLDSGAEYKFVSSTEAEIVKERIDNLVNAYGKIKKSILTDLSIKAKASVYLDIDLFFNLKTFLNGFQAIINAIRLHVIDIAKGTTFIDQVDRDKILISLQPNGQNMESYLDQLNEVLISRLEKAKKDYPISTISEVTKVLLRYINRVEGKDVSLFVINLLEIVILYMADSFINSVKVHSEIGLSGGIEGRLGFGLKARLRGGLAIKETKDIILLEEGRPFGIPKKEKDYKKLFIKIMALNS